MNVVAFMSLEIPFKDTSLIVGNVIFDVDLYRIGDVGMAEDDYKDVEGGRIIIPIDIKVHGMRKDSLSTQIGGHEIPTHAVLEN